MKCLVLFICLLLSVSTFASSALVCTGESGGKQIKVVGGATDVAIDSIRATVGDAEVANFTGPKEVFTQVSRLPGVDKDGNSAGIMSLMGVTGTKSVVVMMDVDGESPQLASVGIKTPEFQIETVTLTCVF